MDPELLFVLRKFSHYYSTADFPIPGLEKREFGIGLEKKIDSRHLGFGNAQELRSYLANNTPLYVSHSVAYYKLPRATPMERKGWLGADLVFDLDLETPNRYLSKEEFARVRGDAIRLVEEFLIPDFGISPGHISVNFSGNRGFHIHVRDGRFGMLRGDERREIIDYVKGTGLKYEYFVSADDNVKGKLIGPKPGDSGYAGRFANRVLELLEKEPDSLGRVMKDESARKTFISGIKSGNWSMSTRTGSIGKKLREIAEKDLALRTVNIDSGVTQDASKLIRVPNSIHGSTGLCAKIVDLKKLAEFEPVHHATLFSAKPLKIIALEDIPELEFGGTTHGKTEKGKTVELPEHFALYLKLKGSAKLVL